jgi:hypothetical protein
MDLIKYRPSLDKVCVATERYDDGRVRWGLWSLWEEPSLVSVSWDPCNLPGAWWWNAVLTGPLIIPAWKPVLAAPKDIADAIAAGYFDDGRSTAAECVDVVRNFSRKGLRQPFQSD